ncbi:MAG TPA: gephyrin-like molybdotransferase Glp [Ktedonobacterales bacterium]|jgi:molybdopterin molybdotransferase|nr:gephyrin-like molybdotransferase Glp [Ktedonobacterales bacterium]
MLTVEEARERVLARFQPLEAEQAPLAEALGRVLAEDTLASEASPPFTNSAMDGYALRSADTRDASEQKPVRLRLAGEVPAGSVYDGVAQSGEAIRILTGAPLPDGADAALQQELTEVADGWVTIRQPVAPGTNIRQRAEDVRPGALLARAGVELGPAEIALLASLGVSPVAVRRRPRVAILATGDELTPLGQPLRPGKIYNSNTPYLIAAVARAGAIPVPLGIAPDQADALRAKLTEAQGHDLILTSGGVSVGDYDLVKQILGEQGAMEFWRVRIRPGKPLAFGFLGQTPLLGLPGNPVSAAVTFELFGRPAIRRMLGAAQVERPTITVTLAGDEQHRTDRRQFVRVRLASDDGQLVAHTTGAQDSHLISSLQGATALLIVPEGEGVIRPGEKAQALLLNDALPWLE